MLTSFVSKGGLGDAWLAFLKVHAAAQVFQPITWSHVASKKYQLEPINELMTLIPKIQTTKCKLEESPVSNGTLTVDGNIKGLSEPFPALRIAPFKNDSPYAVIQPFAGDPSSPRGFAPAAALSVAEAALDMNLDPVLLGASYLSGSDFLAGKRGVSNMTGKTSLKMSLSILKSASLFIGFRGFLAYAAMSMRVPSVVMFESDSSVKRCIHNAWNQGTKILLSPPRIVDSGEVVQKMRIA